MRQERVAGAYVLTNACTSSHDGSTDLKVAGFDWDGGNEEKCQKHGVSLAAIESLFRRSLAVLPYPAHSVQEERFKAIGRTDDARGVLIVFRLRRRGGATFIRPISARYMHRQEIAYYEEETASPAQR